MEISVPEQLCQNANGQLRQPFRDDCQLLVQNAYTVANNPPMFTPKLMECQVAALLPAVLAIAAISDLAGDGAGNLSHQALGQICEKSASVQSDKRRRRRLDVRNEQLARQQEDARHRQELIDQDRQHALALQREQQAARMDAVRLQRRMLPVSQTHMHDFFSVIPNPTVNQPAYNDDEGAFNDSLGRPVLVSRLSTVQPWS
jgi:hypothetical protein